MKENDKMEQVRELNYNNKLTERLENLIKSRDKLKFSSLSPSDSNSSDTTSVNKLSQNSSKALMSVASKSTAANRSFCIDNRCIDSGSNCEHGCKSAKQTSNAHEKGQSKTSSYNEGIMDKQQSVEEDISPVYRKHHEDHDLQVSRLLCILGCILWSIFLGL